MNKNALFRPACRVTLLSAVLILFSVGCGGCAGASLSIKTASAWSQGGGEKNRKLRCGQIRADKSGAAASVEREIAELLPLVFLEKGFVFVADGRPVDYVIDVRATERDYYLGWEAKKSISMEIVLWPAERETAAYHPELAVETPLASGRTVAQGNLGLSSSKNTEILLRRSLGELVKSLAALEKRRPLGTGIAAGAP